MKTLKQKIISFNLFRANNKIYKLFQYAYLVIIIQYIICTFHLERVATEV